MRGRRRKVPCKQFSCPHYCLLYARTLTGCLLAQSERIDTAPPIDRMATQTEVGYRMIADSSWHLHRMWPCRWLYHSQQQQRSLPCWKCPAT